MAKHRIDPQVVLRTITNHYLGSSDFEGISTGQLKTILGISDEALLHSLDYLIEQGMIRVDIDEYRTDHVLMRGASTGIEAKCQLREGAPGHTFVFPHPAHLGKVVDPLRYESRPFTLKLALGAPQLEYAAFDLAVLEAYRGDNRYRCSNGDLQGSISELYEHVIGDERKEGFRILLGTFGFCYDSHLNRAVGVYLRYLAELPPEHQQKWHAWELPGDWKLHPDYLRITNFDHWGDGISIFDALLEELRIVNEISQLMERLPLFGSVYSAELRPGNFGILVRPTRAEYEAFVSLLAQLLTINIGFFRDDALPKANREQNVATSREVEAVLMGWLQTHSHEKDAQALRKIQKAFRSLRKRGKALMQGNGKAFDQAYIHEQRSVMVDVYLGIRGLRLILLEHPTIRHYRQALARGDDDSRFDQGYIGGRRRVRVDIDSDIGTFRSSLTEHPLVRDFSLDDPFNELKIWTI